MTSIIVDTSVAIKWYAEEHEGDLLKARELRKRIVEGSFSLVCPEIIILELINALRYGKKLLSEECIQSIRSFVELCSEMVPIPKADAIVEVVYQQAMASYDAAFVALARERDIPLITADYKHHKKSISPHIFWLSEWK